jgi:phage shock protein PspC (stress-responsive transcriptional regulator)
MSNTVSLAQMRWVRSRDGVVAGVCEGLGRELGIEPWLLRAAWLLAVLMFGTGILFYLILWWAMPREDQLAEAYDKRFLGVCAKMARKSGLDIGLVRALTIMLAVFSFGSTMVGYFVLYFLMPDQKHVIDIPRIEKSSAIRM